jgi:hypothetical protein
MELSDLICGTEGNVCNTYEYPACPETDFYLPGSVTSLRSIDIMTDEHSRELAQAQLDSYVLYGLDEGEQICYREAWDGSGMLEWFVDEGPSGFALSAIGGSFFNPDEEAGAVDKASDTNDNLTIADVAIIMALGFIVLYSMGKTVLDAVEAEWAAKEANKDGDAKAEDRTEARGPFVAPVPDADRAARESDPEPWRAEKWFDGLSETGRLEVDEILREKIPGMLGDPAFRADFVREGKITPEGVRSILAERGLGHTSIGSVVVTRAAETKAAEAKVTPITAGKKVEKSAKKGGFGLRDLFRRAGR